MTDWLSDNRRFLLRFVGTLLAIGLIVLLLRGQGWDEILKAFKQLSFPQILLAFVLILCSRVFALFCAGTFCCVLERSGFPFLMRLHSHSPVYSPIISCRQQLVAM